MSTLIPVGARRATITVYDPTIPGARALYVATVGHTTAPAASPANTYFAERLINPGSLKRDVFDSGTTSGRSRVGYGDCVIANGDGEYDVWISDDYAFDGRAYVVERYTAAGTWVVELSALMEQAVFSRRAITIKLRDRQAELDVPLQKTKFAGDNALPAGVEGVAADLKGKPKVLSYGSVLNVPAPLVNSAKLIHQVHDGEVAGIPNVYDRGIALGSSLVVAAGSGGDDAILSSHDGITFGKSRDNMLPSALIVTCSVEGPAGLLILGSGEGIVTSTTGDTWTYTQIAVGFSIRGLAFDGTTYVAVGDNAGTGEIWTSTDLVAWTQRTPTGFGANVIYCVTFKNAQFVAGGALGLLSTSPTGTTWTAQTTGYGGIIHGITYGASLYVLVGSSNAIYTSPTCVTWTARTSALTGTPTLNCIGFGTVFFVGADGGEIQTSGDGIAWLKRQSPFGPNDTITAANYLGGVYYTGSDNGLIAVSPEGIAWLPADSIYAPGSFIVNTITAATGLGIDNYANSTDLLDDTKAPTPGSYKTYLDGGYFRLGSSPDGVVTADVLEGAAASDRTAAQIATRILTKAGKTTGDWSASDVTALDTANDAVLGLYLDTETSVSDALDQVMGSVGAAWFVDAAGVFRFKQFTAPSGSPVVSFTENDIIAGSLDRVQTNDASRGIPSYKRIVRWGKNYTVQSTDLAAGVDPARRAVIEQEWREASYTDVSVQTAHLLAQQITEDSLLTSEADALAEATRRQGLHGVRRDMFQFTVELNETTAALDLFSVISQAYPRFGLSAGALFRVLGLDPIPAKRRLTITAWK